VQESEREDCSEESEVQRNHCGVSGRFHAQPTRLRRVDSLASLKLGSQIHQACRQANDLDMRLADAVETRIALDLRIGAAFTRLTTLSLQNRVPELAQQVVSYGELRPSSSRVSSSWLKPLVTQVHANFPPSASSSINTTASSPLFPKRSGTST
jgi:hypothetical protein